jgi:hypothetical protein
VSILGHFPLGAAGLRRPRGVAATTGLLATLVTSLAWGAPAEPPRASLARSGDFIVYEPRPVLAHELHACSFRHALCVHASGVAARGAATRAAAEVVALLDAADNAWDAATLGLDLPAPDSALASTGALDLYLVDGDPYATRTLIDLRDPRGGFDRASAFALVGRGVTPGCALEAAAARVVARSILFGVAPATDEGSALAESAYVARLMVPCATGDDVRAFQAHPELGLADTFGPPSDSIAREPARVQTTPGERYASGASLFYDWVDDSFGGSPGSIVRAMWALSPTLTATNAARWNDEPDGFDVLRMSFKNALTTGSTVDDLWLDFAVARAFVPDDPARVEWSIDWPTAPRALMSGAGIAPTGASYIAVDCKGRPKGARLRFEARWEEHARILWTLVRVDAAGREISRVGVPEQDRGTEAQTSLVHLDGVARVLVVGTNAGDPLYPFDPDDYAWEPHGWVVSLAGE